MGCRGVTIHNGLLTLYQSFHGDLVDSSELHTLVCTTADIFQDVHHYCHSLQNCLVQLADYWPISTLVLDAHANNLGSNQTRMLFPRSSPSRAVLGV